MSSRPKRGNNPPALGCARRPLRPVADRRMVWKSGGNPWSFEILERVGGNSTPCSDGPERPQHIIEASRWQRDRLEAGGSFRFFWSCAKHTFTTQAETNICMLVNIYFLPSKLYGSQKHSFWPKTTVVKWNYQILCLDPVTVRQKLGMILVIKWFKNWSYQ